MPAHNNQYASEGGFTLMELLVAISLLAFIAAIILGGTRYGTRVWERTNVSTQTIEEDRMVRQLLSDLISRSYPYFHDSALSGSVPSFVGERHELLFSADAPRQFDIGGLHRFRLLFEELDPESGQIILEWVVDRNGMRDPRSETSSNKSVLLKEVSALEFDYFDGHQWGSRWTEKNGLPELVRINVEREPRKTDWVPLVVEPRIDMDSQCQYDPVSRNCRRR